MQAESGGGAGGWTDTSNSGATSAATDAEAVLPARGAASGVLDEPFDWVDDSEMDKLFSDSQGGLEQLESDVAEVPQLHAPCRSGDVAAIKAALDALSPLSNKEAAESPVVFALNEKDDYLRTPLHYAAWYGHLEIVRLLVTCPWVQLCERDSLTRTPLWFACWAGRASVVEVMLDRALAMRMGDLDSPSLEPEAGLCPLAAAAFKGHIDVLKLLCCPEVAHRIDLDATDTEGHTPFAIACETGQINVVRFLLNDESAAGRFDVNAKSLVRSPAARKLRGQPPSHLA